MLCKGFYRKPDIWYFYFTIGGVEYYLQRLTSLRDQTNCWWIEAMLGRMGNPYCIWLYYSFNETWWKEWQNSSLAVKYSLRLNLQENFFGQRWHNKIQSFTQILIYFYWSLYRFFQAKSMVEMRWKPRNASQPGIQFITLVVECLVDGVIFHGICFK